MICIEKKYTWRGATHGEEVYMEKVTDKEQLFMKKCLLLRMDRSYGWRRDTHGREGMDGEEVDTETNYTQKRVYTERDNMRSRVTHIKKLYKGKSHIGSNNINTRPLSKKVQNRNTPRHSLHIFCMYHPFFTF